MKNWHPYPTSNTPAAEVEPVAQPALAAALDHGAQPENRLVDADAALLAAVLSKTSARPAKPAPRAQAEAAAPVIWNLPGFEGKCRVTTNFGELPVEALRRRDMVKTLSGAYREVKRVDAIRLDADFMERHPAAQPVMIRARAADGLVPARNMLVSPAQKLWLPKQGQRAGAKTALQLEGTPNVLRAHRTEITYYRFHLGEEETVAVEGAWFCTAPY